MPTSTTTRPPRRLRTMLKRGLGRLLERHYRSETAELVDYDELGYDPSERVRYEPSGWLTLRLALAGLGVSRDDVLADLGSGKGRIVVQAARGYPFKRVIGVELSERLNAIARQNLERSRTRLRAGGVELVTGDVLTWRVPDDVTIAYLHNPFVGAVFGEVLDRLVDAVDRRGRPLRLVYVNPTEHSVLAASDRVRELAPARGAVVRLLGWPKGRIRLYEIVPS